MAEEAKEADTETAAAARIPEKDTTALAQEWVSAGLDRPQGGLCQVAGRCLFAAPSEEEPTSWHWWRLSQEAANGASQGYIILA